MNLVGSMVVGRLGLGGGSRGGGLDWVEGAWVGVG